MQAADACRTVVASILTAGAITLCADRVAAQEVHDFTRPEIIDKWDLNSQWLADDFTISKLHSIIQIRVWTWENVLESPYKGQFYWSVMLDGREPVVKRRSPLSEILSRGCSCFVAEFN
jgi:hypothetical protein